MTLPRINAVGINEPAVPPAQAYAPPLVNEWALNSTVINGGVATAPIVEPTGNFSGSARALRPAAFGVPSAVELMVAGPIASLQSVRFGMPMALGGQPPAAWVRLADSLKPVRFGVPALTTSLQVGPVASLQLALFGMPALHCAMPAASLVVGVFGAHQLAIDARSSSLRPVRFGVGHVVHRLGAASLRRVRFGPVSVRLSGLTMPAASFHPAHFGVPLLGGTALRARSMCPVRFGRPMVDRGDIC